MCPGEVYNLVKTRHTQKIKTITKRLQHAYDKWVRSQGKNPTKISKLETDINAEAEIHVAHSWETEWSNLNETKRSSINK